MSLRKRRLFVLFFFILFLFVGTGISFYSQGYRLALDPLSLTKIGGIFIRSTPMDAIYKLDNIQVKNRAWFLQRGTLVNTTPGTHELIVEKEGYQSFKKQLAISPALVSELDSIILLKNVEPNKIEENVINFDILNNQTVTLKKGIGLLYGTSTIPGIQLINGIESEGVFATKKDNEFFIINTKLNPLTITPLHTIFYKLKINKLKLPGETPILEVAHNSLISPLYYLHTEAAFYSLNIETSELVLLKLEKIKNLKFVNKLLFYENGNGQLINYDIQNKRYINLANLESSLINIEYLDTKPAYYLLLKENGSLTLASSTFPNGVVLATNASIFSFSPDQLKIASIDKDNKINIYYLWKPKKHFR